MKRLLFGALVGTVLTVAACGGSDVSTDTTAAPSAAGPSSDWPDDALAAIVDGTQITSAQVDAISIEGAGPTDLAESLRRLILNEVLADAAAEFGVIPTADDVAAARAEIIDEVTSGGALTLADVLISASLTEQAFELIVQQSALADAIDVYLAANAPPPRDEDLQALYDDIAPNRTSVCSAHILLETEQAATATLDRALGGEDFGDLARELSIGPSGPSGGDLGCTNPSDFVPPFAAAVTDAPIGTPVGPVETQFGFHVILVTAREMPTLEELRPELTEILFSEVFPVWLATQVEVADVAVNPRFGTWVTDPSPAVRPPLN